MKYQCKYVWTDKKNGKEKLPSLIHNIQFEVFFL